jgi:ribosomal protein S18 acetylase RimI-like enzyme
LKVRTFSMRDYDVVKELWVSSGLEVRPGDSREEVRRKIRRDPELFVVAEEKGRIVGAAMGTWDGRRGWIYHLGVAQDFRRRGAGRAVVAEIEKRMARKGVPRVNATVFKRNEASKALFASLGYDPDDASVKYSKDLAPQEPGCE